MWKQAGKFRRGVAAMTSPSYASIAYSLSKKSSYTNGCAPAIPQSINNTHEIELVQDKNCKISNLRRMARLTVQYVSGSLPRAVSAQATAKVYYLHEDPKAGARPATPHLPKLRLETKNESCLALPCTIAASRHSLASLGPEELLKGFGEIEG